MIRYLIQKLKDSSSDLVYFTDIDPLKHPLNLSVVGYALTVGSYTLVQNLKSTHPFDGPA